MLFPIPDSPMPPLLPTGRPGLMLAPMQDITDRPFIKVIEEFGGADLYVTEYFRVHQDSRLDPYILSSITENATQKPVIAQMIGQDINAIKKTTLELLQHPVAGIDINLGCPAPVVCRKEAGGALLKNLPKLDRILGTLRELCTEVPFTIKTRIGYDHDDEFENILPLFIKHQPDLLSIHGRTVKNRYQTPVFPRMIAQAVQSMPCPVIANGNVVDTSTGLAYLEQTQAAGLMIGRGAIRHPWIFEELRSSFQNKTFTPQPLSSLLHYIHRLYDETALSWQVFERPKHVQKMKKYLNFITQGLDPQFEHDIRRAKDEEDFFLPLVRRSFLKNHTVTR